MYATTSTVLVGDDGACLLVDPGVTTAELAGLVAELGARGLRPVGRWSTHEHWDHVLTASAWGHVPAWRDGTPGADEDAHAWRDAVRAERDADAVLAAAAPGDRPDVLATLPLPFPRRADVDGTCLDWPGPRTLVVTTPGHAPGHASLWLPELRVLVAGDLLSDAEVPLLDLASDDPLAEYVATLDRLAALRVDVLVPGHGAVAHGDEVAARFVADRAYLDALAGGREPADPRLATPWVAAAHTQQRRALTRT